MKHLIYSVITLHMGEAMSNKFILGISLGLFLAVAINSYPYRTPKPARLTDLKVENQIVQLNEALENLWNVIDGRYSLNIVTTNPDGDRKGDIGDMVLFNDSGTYYLAVNTTGAKIWRSTALTDTP